MRITFFYTCTSCDCNWQSTVSLAGMSFIDSTCVCPSCQEDNLAEDQKLS